MDFYLGSSLHPNYFFGAVCQHQLVALLENLLNFLIMIPKIILQPKPSLKVIKLLGLVVLNEVAFLLVGIPFLSLHLPRHAHQQPRLIPVLHYLVDARLQSPCALVVYNLANFFVLLLNGFLLWLLGSTRCHSLLAFVLGALELRHHPDFLLLRL